MFWLVADALMHGFLLTLGVLGVLVLIDMARYVFGGDRDAG